jgi:tetratricopeptide (TPR) repeat protein
MNKCVDLLENGAVKPHGRIWKIYAHRASILRQVGGNDEMIQKIKKSFSQKPNGSNCWIQLGKVKLKKGEIMASEAAFTNAIEFAASKAYDWHERAKSSMPFKKFDKALDDYNKALELSKTQKPKILYGIGFAHFLWGNFNEANHFFRKSLELGSSNFDYNQAMFQHGIVSKIDEKKGVVF